MEEEILVSICCITYNQEKYIKEALDSFLMQKTNFKYEIIIRDDASTDNTAKIIKEYEKKYPDIVKPIYEIENGYKKGIEPFQITFNNAKGKYISICEGDDYWISERKLQEQVNYMEEHKDCTLCFHDAQILDMKTGKKKKFFPQNPRYKKFFHKNNIYYGAEVDMIGPIPTASMLFRTKDISRIPEWYYTSIVGDRPLKLIMTSFGYAYCINKKMSIYRVNTGNSVMDAIKKQNQKEALKLNDALKQILINYNEFTDNKYCEKVKVINEYIDVDKLYIRNEFKKIINDGKLKYFSFKMKMIIIIRAYIPCIYNKYKAIYKYLSR